MLADVLSDVEPKSDSVLIKLLLVLKDSKGLEKLLLVFWRDSDSCVNHFNNQVLFTVIKILSRNPDSDLSALREFEGVRLETEDHLLDPHLVGADHAVLGVNANVFSVKLQIFSLGLVLLDFQNNIHCVLEFKELDVLSEFL